MPPQLKRLIPLFIIFISLFLLVRHFLIPDSFGQFGHYRGESLTENASIDLVFADSEDCKACHDDVQEKIEHDAHTSLSCLVCHGPGMDHVNDPASGNIDKLAGREFCGKCHEFHDARPTAVVVQVDINTHNSEFQNCIECHNPHAVWEGIK